MHATEQTTVSSSTQRMIAFYDTRMLGNKPYLGVENGVIVFKKNKKTDILGLERIYQVEDLLRSGWWKREQHVPESFYHALYYVRKIIWIKRDNERKLEAQIQRAFDREHLSTHEPIVYKRAPNIALYEGPLPKIQDTGVLCGLPNIDKYGSFGNTCWLNAALAFIATVPFFDDVLNQELDYQWGELHKILRTVIADLRLGLQESRVVEEVLYRELLLQIEKLPGIAAIGQYGDTIEFLQVLMQNLRLTNWFLTVPVGYSTGSLNLQELLSGVSSEDSYMIAIPRTTGANPDPNNIGKMVPSYNWDPITMVDGKIQLGESWYKVRSAIVHNQRDHFVCYSQSNTNGVIVHNDRKLDTLGQVPFGEKASFLMLEKDGPN